MSTLSREQKTVESPRHLACINLVVNVAGSTVPIWAGYLIYQAFSKWNGQWEVFYRNGEFYLYSAAFLSTAAFTFFKNKRKNHGVHSWMFWIMILVIGIASMLFAALRVSADIANGISRMDDKFLFWSSGPMMLYSIIMLFWSLVLENTREPDFKKAETKSVEDLGRAFDELADK